MTLVLELAMVRYMAFGVLLKKKKRKSKQTNNHKFEISAVFWTKKTSLY